jgi:hypothetical protein
VLKRNKNLIYTKNYPTSFFYGCVPQPFLDGDTHFENEKLAMTSRLSKLYKCQISCTKSKLELELFSKTPEDIHNKQICHNTSVENH